MAGLIYIKSSPTDVFALSFVNGVTPMTIGSPAPKILCGPKTSIFGAKIHTSPSSDDHCAGKLKQLV